MFFKQHFTEVIAEEAKKINWNTSSIKSKGEEAVEASLCSNASRARVKVENF